MKSAALIAFAVCALLMLVLLGLRSQRVLTDGLPPIESHPAQASAALAANQFAFANGGRVGAVLGTGSMAPYIPAAPAGVDPRSVIVAYVVFGSQRFEDVKQGDLCSYTPPGHAGENWLHQAAQLDGAGWIMSGYGNARSESWWRMTEANFRGVVVRTFIVEP